MSLTPADVPAMPDAALLEVVLGLPDPGRLALPADDLPSLARLSPVALAERAEVALQAATRLAAAFELGRRLHAARTRRPTRLRRPRDVARFFSATLAPLVHEEVWIAALDAHDGVRGARMVSRGGLLTASVRPADVLRAALELGAVAFVMAHNHPGGDPAPSDDDVVLTREVEHAAHLIGVPLQDHVIVTPAGRFASVFRAGSSRP
ncbi:DNA repair protein [Sorangium cellulosum]|uniref:DNA repair protein n=1 Tax=Sorangium cellulosum TaxID=56 RepID=A0A4P2Q4U8_SORCE|nr:JAB domain-containing protein [Sorangium cellulosum]AUX24066.1 DNA repair protein [Sorangium cellulosum]